MDLTNGRELGRGTPILMECWGKWIDSVSQMVYTRRCELYQHRHKLIGSYYPYMPTPEGIAHRDAVVESLWAQENHLLQIEFGLLSVKAMFTDQSNVMRSGPLLQAPTTPLQTN